MKNELKHHGIIGQKWGKRNGPPYPLDGGGGSGSSRTGHEDSGKKESDKEKKTHKSASSMTNEELNEAISRMEKEKRYKQLMRELNPEKKNKGKEFVKDVITKSGKEVAVSFAKWGMIKLLNTATQSNIMDFNNVKFHDKKAIAESVKKESEKKAKEKAAKIEKESRANADKAKKAKDSVNRKMAEDMTLDELKKKIDRKRLEDDFVRLFG